MAQQFVVLHQKDDAIPFEATLTDENGVAIGSGVTIDVFKPDGTQVVTDAAATLIDAPTGLWRFILSETQNDAYDIWTAHWHWTVDGTARSHRRLVQVVYA